MSTLLRLESLSDSGDSLCNLEYVGSREEWTDGLHPLQLSFGVRDFLVRALILGFHS